MEYYENRGGAVAKLLWSSPSVTKQTIAADKLFVSGQSDSQNLALGKNTSQSSTAWKGDSARAVDGNTRGVYRDGSFTHTASESSPWWKVDLDGVYRVERVVLFNRTDCCGERLSNFHVDLLDANGEVIATADHRPKADITEHFEFDAAGIHGVRVQLYGTNPLSLTEVRVYGPPDSTGGDAGTGSSLSGGSLEPLPHGERNTLLVTMPLDETTS